MEDESFSDADSYRDGYQQETYDDIADAHDNVEDETFSDEDLDLDLADGEDVSISYLSLYQPTAHRQAGAGSSSNHWSSTK